MFKIYKNMILFLKIISVWYGQINYHIEISVYIEGLTAGH